MKARTIFKLNYGTTIKACYIGFVCQAIINNLSPMLFSTYEKSLGISLGKIGLLITVNFGVQMLTDMIAAKYVDRIGYRVAMILAHVAAAVGLIGMGVFPFIFSDAYIGLCIASVISAIGGGLLEVIVSPIVEAAPESSSKSAAMSLLHSFYCWGQVAVVILTTIAFQVFGMERWYYIPIIWALIPLLNMLLFLKVPINTLVEDKERVPMRKLFTKKIFWVLLILMVCAGASEQGISQWASFFAENGLKVSKTIGDLFGPCTFATMMGLSRVFYGKFGAKINLRKFILCSSILCVASYMVTIFSPNPILGLIGCAMCGFSVGIMWPGTFSISAKECPQGGTAMFALLALAGDIGCSAGPGVVSIGSGLYPEYGLKSGFLFAIIFPALMFTIILFYMMKRKKSEKLAN